jgi:tRNA(fMet)-specific endonuclease VapC
MICLDTNIVIAAINRRVPRVRARLVQTNLSTFLALDVTPWPFEPEDAEEAGDIRAGLERAATPIGPYDVLIAAQARRRDALLVTTNTREFTRVPGLKTADWAA